MNICIDCGEDYEYDASNPLGASSCRCGKCRKRNTKFNNRYKILEIAGNGIPQCRKCGYARCPEALVLTNTYEPLTDPKTQEQLEKHAKSQYLLCLNCQQEIKAGLVKAEAKKLPDGVDVSFYYTQVVVQNIKIDPPVIIDALPLSEDTSTVEIVTDEPRGLRDATKRSGRVTSQQVSDM